MVKQEGVVNVDMKPWVEWLLSIALLLLVVSVIVALVVGFVRWFRPSQDSSANSKTSTLEDDGAFEFDLGTPAQSTIYKRRKLRKHRRYTGTSTNGDLYRINVYALTQKINCINITNNSTHTYSYTSNNKFQYDLNPDLNPDNHEDQTVLATALEIPGEGIILGPKQGDSTTCIIALPEEERQLLNETGDTNVYIPTGMFGYMHVSEDLERTQVGFISSMHGTTQNTHRLDHQSFAPFPIDQPQSQLSEDKYGCRVFGATGMELNELVHENEDRTIISAKNDMHIFISQSGAPIGVSIPKQKGAIFMLPQLPSEDFPFPCRAHYKAILISKSKNSNLQQDSHNFDTNTWNMVQKSPDSIWKSGLIVNVEVIASSGYIRLSDGERRLSDGERRLSDGERRAAESNQEVFEGILKAVASLPDLFDASIFNKHQLIDPCYGTFIAKNKLNDILIAQFYKNWCIITGKIAQQHIAAFGLAK